MKTVPLRVDFAGGWLDVPKLARPGGRIVNCAISPLVSLETWPYETCAGLGGSAARAILEGRSGVDAELDLGVGWQDPAVIQETGLCIWRSGERPSLELRSDGAWLRGCLSILWTGKRHCTPDLVDRERDYERIIYAGWSAADAVRSERIGHLACAVLTSYRSQLDEGMEPLSDSGALAHKYLGGGHGGYALYLWPDGDKRSAAMNDIPELIAVEPYDRWEGLA